MASRIQFPNEQKNYTGMTALLKTSRDGIRKPLSHNCDVVSRGHNIAIRLHRTDIITYTPDGLCILKANGWSTPTTKRYMEGYAPCSVFMKNFEMFVTVGDETVPLYDGLTIDLTTHTIAK